MTTYAVGRELCSFMVRIRCLVKIGQVAAHASAGRIVVIAVVTGSTVIGDSRMRPVEGVIVVVVGKSCRRPAWLSRMAAGTVIAEAQRYVIGVTGLIEIGSVTTSTGVGGIIVVSVVTSSTLIGNNGMPSRQGIKVIMVKGSRYPGRLCVTILTIRRELSCFMVWIGGAVVVAEVAAHAGIGRIVVITIVACRAIIGYTRVRPVERIVVVVVGKSCRRPAWLGCVAAGAVIAEAQRYVVGVTGLVEISAMAARTGVGRVVVVTVMTGSTLISNHCMPARKWVKVVMIETRGNPRVFRVAILTVGRELRSFVVRIGGSIVVGQVTANTGIGRVVVIAIMTGSAVVGNGGMRSVERIENVMVKAGR